MRLIKKGATSQSLYVEILDSTSTTGGRKTGLAYNTSSLVAYYVRAGGSATAITLATLAAANSAWSSGGFKEVDATNMNGIYRLDVPDAAFASGADSVVVTIKGATGMVQVSIAVQLVAWDPQDSVRGGLTALPNAAAEAAGGLYTRGSGAGQINQPANGMIDANVVRNAGTAIVSASGRQEVNLTHVDGTALGTHGSGQIPADVRQYGGSAGTFASGRPEVNTSHLAGSAVDQSGGLINANVKQISGDATAADNAESFFDGTGYAGTNNVIPTVTTLTNAPSDSSGVTTLLSRLTSARAGYLDVLNGIVAAIWAAVVDSSGVTTLLSRLSSARAGYLDNINNSALQTTAAQTGDSYAIVNSGTHGNAAIKGYVDDIGAAGAGLSAIPWNAAWDAEVQSEVQDAIEANHLDHLLAVTYDPASKPGAADALLNELVESDSGVSRFTANALEQAPSGGGGGSTDWTSDERTAIRSILGIPASGTTPEDPSSGILDTIRDSVATRASQTSVDDLPTNAELATALGTSDDAVLAAIAALNNLSQANIRTALGMASANLDTQLDALPTNAELATALGTADDAVLAAVAALNNLSSAQVQTAAAAALTAYDPPTHAELVSEINSVQSDIAGLNNLSAAQVNAEVDAALADYDGPTRAEATADKDEVITQVNANETKIDAVQAKTGQLTFTKANELDANIQSVNGVTVVGTGASGDEWGA